MHKINRPLILSILLLVLSSTSQVVFALALDPVRHTKAQSETVKNILITLGTRHYDEITVDNVLSERFLDAYINSLDPAHMFFYAKDVDTFSKHQHIFDDDFKLGKLDKAFEIYDIFRKRAASRLESTIEILNDENIKFTFTDKDEVLVDRSEAPWPATVAEADELWFKRLKLSLLNIKLTGKTLEKARETMSKRYTMQLKRISQEDNADVFETVANALTTLYDPHTNYWSARTAENFKINMSLTLQGIGAVLQTEDEYTKVVRLVPGGPADKQGQLASTDKIIGVGQGEEGEIVDVIGWRLSEVVNLIRGPKNTVVKLEVLRKDESSEVFKIRRDEVKLEDQAAEKAILNIENKGQSYKLGIIYLPAFYIDFEAYSNRDKNYRSSARDVERLVNELKRENVDGIIVDLRNNGGGSLTEATNLTDLFIDQGPVVQIRSPSVPISRPNRSFRTAIYRGPLIVMVNRLSASASEIFAGAIQDYDRGLIVGTQTFGKGTVQSVRKLIEGELKITESKFYRVSGDSTQHRGIIPDIVYPELIDTDEVGESAYDNALPWDQIHPVPHEKYFDFSVVVQKLVSNHKVRSIKDPDFEYILDQIDILNKNKDRNTISINENQRLQEKQFLETAAMEIENKRLVAKGEKPFKSIEDFRKNEEKEEEEEAAAAHQGIDLENDALLLETGNILVDYINLSNTAELKQASNF